MHPLPTGLRCAGCDAGLVPAEVDLVRAVARCSRCGAEHRLSVELVHDPAGTGWRPSRPALPSSGLDPAPAAAVVRVAEVQAVDTGPIRVPVPNGRARRQADADAGPLHDADDPADLAPTRAAGLRERLEQLRVRVGDGLERIEAVGVRRWVGQRIGDWPTFPTGMPSPATALQTAEDPHGLRLEWGWFGLPAVALMMGTAVFATWIGGWIAAAVLLAGTGIGFLFALAAVVHLLATLGLTYAATAGLLDRTRVRVRDGALDVWHGPVPWPGPRRIPAARVSGLRVVPRSVRGREGEVELFDVVAVLSGARARRVVVARGAWTRDAAEALVQRIEAHLGGEGGAYGESAARS